jgi:hypothetical protein
MTKSLNRTFLSNREMVKNGSGKYYEGPKIIQEFANITKASKKVRSFE